MCKNPDHTCVVSREQPTCGSVPCESRWGGKEIGAVGSVPACDRLGQEWRLAAFNAHFPTIVLSALFCDHRAVRHMGDLIGQKSKKPKGEV